MSTSRPTSSTGVQGPPAPPDTRTWPDKPERPERPERRRGPWGYVVIGLVVAVMAGGWGVIMANAGRTPGVQAETIAYDVVSDTRVTITYAVATSGNDRVRCTVDAFDTNFAVLAAKEVVVPAGTGEVRATETLTTARRANGARIKDCRAG